MYKIVAYSTNRKGEPVVGKKWLYTSYDKFVDWFERHEKKYFSYALKGYVFRNNKWVEIPKSDAGKN